MWTVTAYDQLKFQCWDDESYGVVYHRQSGDVHLIDRIGFQILTLIGNGTGAFPFIQQSILFDYLDGSEDEITDCIVSSLTQLENAGLLSRVES